MKYCLFFIALLSFYSGYSQNPNPLAYSYTTLGEMASRKANLNAKANVSDNVRGGLFELHAASEGYIVDSGTVLPSATAGYVWVRQFDKAAGLNLKWFKANIGDSTTVAYDAFLLAKQAASNQNIHTINFPAGKFVAADAFGWYINQSHLKLKGEGQDKTVLLPAAGTINGGIQIAPYRDAGWDLTPSRQYTYEDTAAIGQDYIVIKAGQDISAFYPGRLIYITDGASYYDQYYAEFNKVTKVQGRKVYLEHNLTRDMTFTRGSWYGSLTAPFTIPAEGQTAVAQIYNPPAASNYTISINNNLLQVISVSGNSVTVLNLAGKGNAVGTTLPSGSYVMKGRAVIFPNSAIEDVTVEDMTVVGRRKAVTISNSYNTNFKNVFFKWLPAADNGGIWLDGDDGGYTTFENCTVSAPYFFPSQIARSFVGFTARNCTFNNTSVDFTEFASQNTIDHCVFDLGTDTTASYVNNPAITIGSSTGNNTITYNTIYASNRYVVIASNPDIQIWKGQSGNKTDISNNTIFLNNCTYGFNILRNGDVILDNNHLYGSVSVPFNVDGINYSDTSNMYDAVGKFAFSNSLRVSNNTFSGKLDYVSGRIWHNIEFTGNTFNREGSFSSAGDARGQAVGNIIQNDQSDATQPNRLIVKNNIFRHWNYAGQVFRLPYGFDSLHTDISLNYFYDAQGGAKSDFISTIFTPYDNRYTFKGAAGSSGGRTYYAQPPITKVNDSTFGIPQSGTSQDGYLSSVDWNTFNTKIGDTSQIHSQLVQLFTQVGSNTNSANNRFDSLRNNNGVLEGRKNNVFVPQFTLPVPGNNGAITGAGNATAQGFTNTGSVSGTNVIITPSFNYLDYPLQSDLAIPANGFVRMGFNQNRNFMYRNDLGYRRVFKVNVSGDDTIYYPAKANPTLADSASVVGRTDTSLLSLKSSTRYGYATPYSTSFGDSVLYTPKKVIHFYGDSYTSWGQANPPSLRWTTQTALYLSAIEDNRGIAGTRISQNSANDSAMINRIYTIVPYDSATTMGIYFQYGLNDALTGTADTSQIRTDLNTIIDSTTGNRCRYPKSRIVFVGPGQVTYVGANYAKIIQVNNIIKDVATKRGVSFADVRSFIAKEGYAGSQAIMFTDSLHFGNLGWYIMTRAALDGWQLKHATISVDKGKRDIYGYLTVQANPGESSPVVAAFKDSTGNNFLEIKGNATNGGLFLGVNNTATGGTNNHVFSIGGFAANTTGYDNMVIGRLSMSANTTGYQNVAVGSQVLRFNTTGFSSVAIGNTAGASNTTGYQNVYIGNNAGYASQTGRLNVIIGPEAGKSSVGSHEITLVGASAGTANLAGTTTAFGNNALAGNTTGVMNYGAGYYAGSTITTGGYNTGTGGQVLQTLTTGSYNTADGYYAGRHIADGTSTNSTANNSLYLGAFTKAKQAGGTNEIVIGYNAIGNGSNTVTIGNTYVAANIFGGGTLTIPSIPTSSNGTDSVLVVNGGIINKVLRSSFSSGGGGTTTNALTFNNSGTGDASGGTFNGSAAKTISYNSLGAEPAQTGTGIVYKNAGVTGYSNPIDGALAIGNSTTKGVYFNNNLFWDNNNTILRAGFGVDVQASSTVPTPATGHAVFWMDSSSGSVKVTKNVGGTITTAVIF